MAVDTIQRGGKNDIYCRYYIWSYWSWNPNRFWSLFLGRRSCPRVHCGFLSSFHDFSHLGIFSPNLVFFSILFIRVSFILFNVVFYKYFLLRTDFKFLCSVSSLTKHFWKWSQIKKNACSVRYFSKTTNLNFMIERQIFTFISTFSHLRNFSKFKTSDEPYVESERKPK